MKSIAKNISKAMMIKGFYLLFCFNSILISASEIPLTTSSEKAFVSFIEGRDKLENLDIDSAAVYFDEAISEDSTFSLAYLYRAITISNGNYKFYLDKANSFNEKISAGEKLLIKIYGAFLENKIENIRNDLTELANDFLFDKRVHNIIGIYLSKMGDKEGAIKHFKTAIDLDNTYVFAYYNIAVSFLETGNYQLAEEIYDKIIQLVPAKSDISCIPAKILMFMKDYEKAQSLFINIFRNDTSCVESLAFQGHNYLLIGKYDLAKKIYKQWNNISLNPVDKNYSRYFEALADIYQDNYEEAKKIINSTKHSDNSSSMVLKLIDYNSHPSLSDAALEELFEKKSKEEVVFKTINNYSRTSSRLPFLMKPILFPE